MSGPAEDQKRRPPPIQIPPPLPRLPHALPPRPSSRQQSHRGENRHATSSTQQDAHTAPSPLTSPLEHDGSRRLFPSGSQHSGSTKSRASAINALTTLMEESRASSRKSDQGSTIAKSTAHSRHSERSNHSAAGAQAQLEALDADERTSRGRIEARGEVNLFKMTGQVPPTPILEATGKDDIVILRQDLREECRAVSAEKKPERQEPIKSPKKKLFGMNMPSFGRSNTPVPPMPSKAAQVLGQEPRNPTKAVVRPMKPADPIKTPTKAPRSDTSKSLPAKLLSQSTYTRSHHSSAARRNRAAGRRSPPRGGRRPSDTQRPPIAPNLSASFEFAAPPTPPAKDTPPECKPAAGRPASPLRRAAPGTDRLREHYEADVDEAPMTQFPAFALSPSPAKPYDAEVAGKSPTKHLPYTADEYQKLIAGEPLPWASLAQDGSPAQHRISPLTFSPLGGNLAGPLDMPAKHWSEEDFRKYHHDSKDSHSALLEKENRGSLQLPREERRSEDYLQSHRSSRLYSPLPPRFYSPSNRSVQLFADGETPSKNSDTNRLLCTVTSKTDLFRVRTDSNNGSIDMVYQGDLKDVEQQSMAGELIDSGNESSMLVPARPDSGFSTRVMQELRVNEQPTSAPHEKGLQPDQSCSRLTDMLHGVSPHRGDSNGDFRANCPSAVPSPLHQVPGIRVPVQPVDPLMHTPGPPRLPFVPKSIDDHFYMTNEHLDVMGKSSWDHVETVRKELLGSASHRQATLMATMESHVQGIKMQIDSVNEKADRATEQSHNMHTKLEELFNFIKSDVMGALDAQNKQMATLEKDVKDLHKTVHAIQQMLEQKQSEKTCGQQHAPAAPTPVPVHRSQASLAGYYGNMAECGREGQAQVQHMAEHRNSGHVHEPMTDARAAYGGNYGQQWGPRAGYNGRGSKEDRPYSATNPYNMANGAANSGQYGNGYNGGYSYT